MSREFASNRRRGIQLSLRLGAIISAACLLIAVFAAALSGPFSRILFPEHPQLCQLVLLLTIWALPLTAIDSALGYALNAAGADAAQARASLPAAICNVVLLLLLISQLGIVGACIALPLRSVVRIIMLGTCCLRLRLTDRLSKSSTIPFVPGTANA